MSAGFLIAATNKANDQNPGEKARKTGATPLTLKRCPSFFLLCVNARHIFRPYSKRILKLATGGDVAEGGVMRITPPYCFSEQQKWGCPDAIAGEANCLSYAAFFDFFPTGFAAAASCSSSSPLRIAEISVSMTPGSLSSNGITMAVLPLSNS